MLKRVSKTKHKSRQAFTLVELIVVLVILAVIAAMLVPALIGYIDRTRKEKYYTNAHYALTAAQATISELYASRDSYTPVYYDANNVAIPTNVNWKTSTNQKWGDKVLQLMDRKRGENEPYILVFGVGHPHEKAGCSTSEQYTVYYLAYVETPDAPAVFYVNGEWMYKYPRNSNNKGKVIATKKINGIEFRNTVVLNDANVPLQFYVVSNESGLDPTKSEFWTNNNGKSLFSHSDGFAD